VDKTLLQSLLASSIWGAVVGVMTWLTSSNRERKNYEIALKRLEMDQATAARKLDDEDDAIKTKLRDELRTTVDRLTKENEVLRAENTRLTGENAQLNVKVSVFEETERSRQPNSHRPHRR
jgi:hypothetical protein